MMQEIDDERDRLFKSARKRISKYNDSISHNLGVIETGKVNWLYEKMKSIRGICG